MRTLAILALVAFAGCISASIESRPDGSYTATRLWSDVPLVVETPEGGGSVAAAPSGGDGWANGWTGISSSPRMWLPDPLSADSFSVSYRGNPSPPAYVNFGLTDLEGRSGVMYRQMDQGEPVWNASRRTGLALPDNTMAVHLEFWHYMEPGEGLNGKRFGFESHPNAAGGGVIAGVDDATTLGLGLPGGWSVRFTPRPRSGATTTFDKYALYTYSQNRRDDGAPFANGKLYGATFNTPNASGVVGSWVKINWTIVMNSPYTADGRMLLWVDNALVLDKGGILWQEDIAQHPIRSFYWGWMWGGVPGKFPPSWTFREYYGDARVGVTSRTNALENPWPF